MVSEAPPFGPNSASCRVNASTSLSLARLARVADEPTRTALAARLGITLKPVRPDRLDQLLFQAADLTEASLKTLFGLEETTVKPLIASLLPEPVLSTWQKEQLRAGWRSQDDAARSEFATAVPLIDPDLISDADLRTPTPGVAAYDLLKARRDDLAKFATELDTQRKGQKNQQAGFDKIVSTVAPIAELLALAEQRRQGSAIDDSSAPSTCRSRRSCT